MREIIPNILWIGNAGDARNVQSVMDAGVQVVIDLAIEEPPFLLPREIISCRIPLLDGEGNHPARIRSAVDFITQFVKEQIPTLVACSGGMSRSPLIVSAVVATIEAITFDEAVRRVTTAGPCDLSPKLHGSVKQLLDRDNESGK